VRGYRIEPGEISAVLTTHPTVREALVVARPTPSGPDELVAYVVGASIDPVELRAHCARSLPEHMLPASIVVLDRLPLGPTGKVDRRALPAPTATGAGGSFVAPRGPLEEALAELWTEVLGRPVGAFDDFFKVGGHSLAATRVITRVRRDFAIQVPVRALFESPRLADFAAALVALEVETQNGTD
jgi:hypothetical protein